MNDLLSVLTGIADGLTPRGVVFALTAALFGFCLPVCALTVHAEPADDDYVGQIRAWDAQRESGLRRETGWLTLVGLFPLAPGEQRIGSAADNDIVLPEGAAAHVGRLRLEEGTVTAEFAPGVQVQKDGVEVTGPMVMIPDTEKDPTILDMRRFQFHLIDRSGRKYLRLKDRESPVLRNFKGIDRFPVLG